MDENFFYDGVRNIPSQKIGESSAQQHSPQHSVRFLEILSVSQTITHRKTVMTVRNSMITVTPQKIQKELMPSIVDVDPMKKAMQSVTDVIVIDGPACIIPFLILSEVGQFSGV